MIEQEKKSAVVYSNTFYILPMLQLNKSSFGVDNFIASYIDKNGYIVVDLKDNKRLIDNKYIIEHPDYITDYDLDNGGLRVVYSIPDQHLADIERYINGKYSQFSAELKVAISKYGQLAANNIFLKALNPQIGDRQKLANEYGVNVDLIKELVSAPSDSNFIRIK